MSDLEARLDADVGRVESQLAGKSLRIATINVHGWKDMGYNGIVEMLANYECDVVALNELLEWKPLAKLARQLKMHYVGTGCGSGILSRYPVSEAQTVAVEDHDFKDRRVFRAAVRNGRWLPVKDSGMSSGQMDVPRIVKALIHHPDGPFEFYAVYLNSSSEPHRMRQMGNLFSAMDNRQATTDVPAVMAGDFNSVTFEDYTTEQFEALARYKKENGREALTNELTNHMKERGYVDCWQVSDTKIGPLATCSYRTRIDYIWASASFTAQFQPKQTEVVEMIERGLTDHNMVVCSFNV